ncbi:MAG: ornithine cyclodeaminase family protein [Nitrososphaerota archaeon]|nr:ornithine cyclodeaminase family protein [Nitrososphaerota archaeon]
MRILTLDAEAVSSACPMDACIEEMSRAFSLQARGRFRSPLRTRLEAPRGDVLVMPSIARRDGEEGSVKVVSIFPKNRGRTPSVTAVVLLLDGETGEARALLEGTTLTAIRTGAVSGLSCRYLARRDSKTLGIVGAGGQAFQQVRGVATAIPGIGKVKAYSRRAARSKALARECARSLGLEARAVDSASACVRGSDVVVAATSSATPVFDGADVGDGTHVIAIGSYRPDARELDSSLVSRASVYVDSREAAMEEAGDILIPMVEGVVPRDVIKGDMCELVTGRSKGRRSASEVTVFKSVGLALEDNAAGWLAYRTALRRKAGEWSEV